jgi:hypothetical protein
MLVITPSSHSRLISNRPNYDYNDEHSSVGGINFETDTFNWSTVMEASDGRRDDAGYGNTDTGYGYGNGGMGYGYEDGGVDMKIVQHYALRTVREIVMSTHNTVNVDGLFSSSLRPSNRVSQQRQMSQHG